MFGINYIVSVVFVALYNAIMWQNY